MKVQSTQIKISADGDEATVLLALLSASEFLDVISEESTDCLERCDPDTWSSMVRAANSRAALGPLASALRNVIEGG